ncbi:hypothetical protein LTR56_007124 [Elasticomyces elasticus]|nr:hypothetical protein LTR22_020455 [Elasticomyces elasticus]KAK3648992.1 hypothetical protein LTR56_007124 [Elasticomyces elasticus]KAK4917808.1 hypothetical protein LTR49_014345 [Elasticomyces elasticus]KAK5750480.1 hypothetical protein LTS12_019438 [Elasticomyces elasticus]
MANNNYYNAPAQEWDSDFMLADSDEPNNHPNTRPTSSSTFASPSPTQRIAHRDPRAEADELRQAHSERRAHMGNAQSNAQANNPSHPQQHQQQPSEVIDLVNTPATFTSNFPRISAPSRDPRLDDYHFQSELQDRYQPRPAQPRPQTENFTATAEQEQQEENEHDFAELVSSSNNDQNEEDEDERASNASWDSSIDGGIEHMYPLRTDRRGRLRAVRRNSDGDGESEDGGGRDRHSGFQFDNDRVVDLTEEELEASLDRIPTRTEVGGGEQQGYRGVKRRADAELSTGHGSASEGGASNKRRKPTTTSGPSIRRPARPNNNTEEVESLDLTGSPTTTQQSLLQAQQADMIAAQTSSSEQPQRIGKRTCIICMEPYTNATITSCGHIYCHECLTMALKAGEKNSERGMGNCPVCRKSVSRKKAGGMVAVSFMTKKGFGKGKGRRTLG